MSKNNLIDFWSLMEVNIQNLGVITVRLNINFGFILISIRKLEIFPSKFLQQLEISMLKFSQNLKSKFLLGYIQKLINLVYIKTLNRSQFNRYVVLILLKFIIKI